MIDTTASASPDHVECQGKRLILHGICAVSVRIAAGGDVVSEEFTVPFRCESDAASEAGGDDLLWRCAYETGFSRRALEAIGIP